MINAGEYNKKISIYVETETEDNAGFKVKSKSIVLNAWAKVKTTKGFTLLKNNTDFEQAHTNFTIRFPKQEITRDMLIEYKGKTYTIEYLNNVDENNVELEIQAKAVVK
jgi:SPP1 family predicted phage head-tail adaptor